jgi:hypothetical protein
VRFWISRNKILLYMGIPWERLCCRRDYLRIWRVKPLYHPHIFCDSIWSHLICQIKFHERYIREILRIPCISSDGNDYHLLPLVHYSFDLNLVWYIFSEEAEAILINNIKSWETISFWRFFWKNLPEREDVVMIFCDLLRLRLTLRLQFSRTKFSF